MAEVTTVKKLAQDLNIPLDTLLRHLEEALHVKGTASAQLGAESVIDSDKRNYYWIM